MVDQPWGDICDGDEKKKMLLETCAALGIAPAQAIAVGDGANDLPMMAVAGLSVAYHAKPKVRARRWWRSTAAGSTGCSKSSKTAASAPAADTRRSVDDALGANLGTRLVACAVLLLHLEGRDWRAASHAFARLEALLKQLVVRHGGEVWPVAYLDHPEFEKYRLALAPRRSVEEALQSTQPETSTMAYVSTTMPPDS